MEENELIEFKFKWVAQDYDKIAPNVLALANKMLEMNLIKVKPELDNEGNIVIEHMGVCKRIGFVECLSNGIVMQKTYPYTFRTKNDSMLVGFCYDETREFNNCNMPSCPILVAGYLYYQKYKTRDEETEEEFFEGAVDNDVYVRNYNELKKLNLNADIEEFIAPLAMPNVRSLRCAFIGEEGTDKDSEINKIAEYLFRIGKIMKNKVININLGEIGNRDFNFEKEYLYSITDLKDYLDLILDNDDFSSRAEEGRMVIKDGIKKIVSQNKDRYLIINTSPLEFKKFLETNPKLPYIFDNSIYFKDYDDEKILELFEQNLPQYHKDLLNENNKKVFLSYLEKNRKYFPFKNEDLALFLAGYVSRKEELNFPKERYDKSNIEDMFNKLIGMDNVKKQIRELNSFLLLRSKLEKQGIKVPDFNLHMMFLGNPGTGKTTVARMIAKILFDLGYIRENKCIEVEAKDLMAAFSGQTALKTSRVINSALGGVLFIDEAYALAQGEYGAESIATLVKAMEDNKGEIVVIFAGYTKEMQEFVRTNSGITSRIGYTFEFADYTEEELFEILKLKVEKINFSISDEAIDSIREIINFGKNRRNFGNGRYIDNILQKALTKHSQLNLDEKNMLVLTKDSIPTMEEILTQSSGVRQPEMIEELFKDIVGMEKIKEQVIQLGKYIKFRNELSKTSKVILPEMRLHMLFTGDAGTGKTTMARKITEMLYNIGCIRINKLVEVERKDLVGNYVGETAPKTEKVLESALGGVLFIDEAYSLTPKDSALDYGKEAIATIIKYMEDHRDELVVIFAGYTNEMKDFVNSNSGIASRIGYTFKFENYKTEELYKIFEVKCEKFKLKINQNVKEKLIEIFKFFSSVENFGNGRFVDKVLQEVLIKHAMNEKLGENIDKLMIEDIPEIKEMAEKTFTNEDNLTFPSDIDEEARRWTAIHEIGHAIVEYLHNGETTLKMITVIPEGNGALGYVLHTQPKEKIHLTKRDYLDMIDVKLAGRASEEVILGKFSGGSWNDLEKATNIVTNMLEVKGMSDTIGLVSAVKIAPSLEMAQNLDKEKKRILEECYEETKKMIEENRGLFDLVVDELMTKGTLSGEEFIELLKRKLENI